MRPTGLGFRWPGVPTSTSADVMALHYFGRRPGRVPRSQTVWSVCSNAHCRHLGADLSHGGCVVEGGIQCPLHGWVWSGDGRPQTFHIPYEQSPVDDPAVRCWGGHRTQRMHLHLARDQAVSPALGRCRICTKRSTARSDDTTFRPIGPDEKTVLRWDCGGLRNWSVENNRRCTALPVRTSCPTEPDRPSRGHQRLHVARQAGVRWRRSR